MTTSTFPAAGLTGLVARLGQGSITVTAQDDITEARVTLTARDNAPGVLDRVTVERRGHELVVLAPRQGGIFELPIFGRNGAREAIDVSVVVPSGTDLRISAFTADITVVGRAGHTHLAYGSSHAVVDTVAGDLTLRFGNGDADVQRVQGSATVRSGSGSVSLGEVGGTLSSGFGSGNLRVGRAHGAVRARAGSGAASLGAAYGDVDLASGSGAMTIGVPSGVSAKLDVISGSGDVTTDMTIVDAPATERSPITVRARTGSGPVRIVAAS